LVLESRSEIFQKDSIEIHDMKKKRPKFSNEVLVSTKGFSEMFLQGLLRPLRKNPARTKKYINGYSYPAIEL
jgi:hypothetical protein